MEILIHNTTVKNSLITCFWIYILQPHRPRNEGGGGRHKKRVRQPHNTRERQRQLAVGHGEYIMPQNIHYRTPQVLLSSYAAVMSHFHTVYDTEDLKGEKCQQFIYECGHILLWHTVIL